MFVSSCLFVSVSGRLVVVAFMLCYLMCRRLANVFVSWLFICELCTTLSAVLIFLDCDFSPCVAVFWRRVWPAGPKVLQSFCLDI